MGREVDGELAGGLWAELSAHLKNCRTCLSEFEEMKDLRALVASLPAQEPSAGLAAMIVEAARFKRTSVEPPLSPAAVLGRIAAALLIAAAGLYLGARFQSSYASSGAPAATVSQDVSAAGQAGEFQLVPPDSPGAQCLALLEGKSR